MEIIWSYDSFKEFYTLPDNIKKRIVHYIDEVKANPFTGRQLRKDLNGLMLLEVGKYHLSYAFDGDRVMILAIRH